MFTIEEIKEMPIEERLKVLEMRAKFQKKKAQVMAEVKRIPKNGFNKFHGYEYSTESDVKEGVRSLLSEHGLTLDIELKEDSKALVDTKQGKQWLHTVKMEFILTDNDTGYMDIKTSKGEGTDVGDKGIYKAYAGCIKYYLINNFLLSTGELDTDPEAGDVDQVHNGNKGNKGNRNNGNNRNGNNRNNNQNQNKQQQKPKATRSGIEAKWKQLNNGSLEGLDAYIEKKGGDLEAIDQILIGRMQAKQAEKKKAEKEANQKPEDFNQDLEEIRKESQNNTDPKTVTDVETGTTVEYNGKEIYFE